MRSPVTRQLKKWARPAAPLLAALGTLVLQACAEPKPKPTKPPEPVSRHKAVNPLAAPEPDDGMKLSGDILGSLDQQSIREGINTRFASAAACIQRRLRRQPYLGGTVTLEFRIARDGKVKRLRITETNLGAFGVERCVQQQMRGAIFPKPRGGEAEFTYPLSLQSRLPVQIWDPAMVKEEMTDNREVLLGLPPPEPKIKRKRRRSRRRRRARRRRRKPARPAPAAGVELVAPDGLVLTFYVDRRGRTVSAGMVADSAVDEDFAERFIANLKKIKFEGATSHRYAKVTYRW